MKQRVCLKDVAAKAGVSIAAVSMALRNRHRIGKGTSRRIRRIAGQLGYTPDPALGALAAYRKARRVVSEYGTLVYASLFNTPFGWKADSTFAAQFSGAEARACEMGYKLENFWLAEPGLSWRRASRILWHRGIRGVVVAPLPAPHGRALLDWTRFSAVALGRSLIEPRLHHVAADIYENVFLAWRQLVRLGYRRIGLIYSLTAASRTNYLGLAANLMQQQLRHSGMVELPALVVLTWHEPEFEKIQAWLDAERPDAVIVDHQRGHEFLGQLGCKIPRRLGVAALDVQHPGVSGISQNHGRIGAAAIDFLHFMLERNETGIPEFPEKHLTSGSWQKGKTLLAKPPLPNPGRPRRSARSKP